MPLSTHCGTHSSRQRCAGVCLKLELAKPNSLCPPRRSAVVSTATGEPTVVPGKRKTIYRSDSCPLDITPRTRGSSLRDLASMASSLDPQLTARELRPCDYSGCSASAFRRLFCVPCEPLLALRDDGTKEVVFEQASPDLRLVATPRRDRHAAEHPP